MAKIHKLGKDEAAPWETEKVAPTRAITLDSSEAAPWEKPKKEKSIGEFLLNKAPRSAYGLVKDLAGLVTSPVQSGKAAVKVALGAPLAIAQSLSGNTDPAAYGASPFQQRAADTSRAFGSYFKERYTHPLETAYEDPFGALLDVSGVLGLAGKGASLARLPRAGAALTRTGEVVNPLTQAGRVAGRIPSPPIVGPMVKGAVQGVQDIFNPKAAYYRGATEGQIPEIVNALQSFESEIPGYKPTTARALAGMDITKPQALTKEASDILPTEYLQRDVANKKALLNQMIKLAKTPAKLEKLKELRKETANALYAVSDQKVVPVDEKLTSLLETASGQAAIKVANTIASDEQRALFSEIPVLRRDAFGGVVSSEKVPHISGNSLHDIKTSLDSLIKNPEQFGIAASQKKAMVGLRNKLIDWTEANIPEYGDARRTYGEMSKPINKIEVGQYLKEKLGPSLKEDTSKMSAQQFESALKNAPSTLKKATGEDRYQKLEQIYGPDEMKKISSITRELQAQAKMEEGAARARGTVPALGAKAAKVKAFPSLIDRTVTIANAIISKLAGEISKKHAMEIALEMLDPQVAAAALKKMGKKAKKPSKIAPILRSPLTYRGTNALNTIREQQEE